MYGLLAFYRCARAIQNGPKVFYINSSSSAQAVATLALLYSRNGVPEQSVGDGGGQFLSAESQLFVQRNDIKPITSAPYNPAANGAEESCS